jgi:hypothetical protein
MSTPSLNEQRLDVLIMLRAMLINGHVIKLQELEYQISKVEEDIELERKNGTLLNSY